MQTPLLSKPSFFESFRLAICFVTSYTSMLFYHMIRYPTENNYCTGRDANAGAPLPSSNYLLFQGIHAFVNHYS